MAPKKRARQASAAGTRQAFSLLDLPELVLRLIVSFMDGPSMKRFFGVSKGTEEQPGCALLVLQSGRKVKVSRTASAVNTRSMEKATTRNKTILWASQQCSNMEVALDFNDQELKDVLHGLLQSQRQRPAAHPGVTSLRLMNVNSTCLLPQVLAVAFPNLKRLELSKVWISKSKLKPEKAERFASLEHISMRFRLIELRNKPGYYPVSWAVLTHIAQQLGCLPQLTSLTLQDRDDVLEAMPARVLGQLTALTLNASEKCSIKRKAALSKCSELEKLCLYGRVDTVGKYVSRLPTSLPHIRELHLNVQLTATQMARVLALTDLTTLTLASLEAVKADHSRSAKASRNLRQLSIRGVCHSACLTKLPLQTLDRPVQCGTFLLQPSGKHGSNMSAIRRAQPHLLRCGGIKLAPAMGKTTLVFSGAGCASWPLTKEHAEVLLEEWAPCFVRSPDRVRLQDFEPSDQALVEEFVREVWPDVEVV